MSAAKTKARAVRSPRATTPKAAQPARPWYAPRPRWYVDGDGWLCRRDRTPYNVRPIAPCSSCTAAEQLARALNRGERDAGRVEGLRAALRGSADRSEALFLALRQLVDAVCAAQKPAPAFAKRAANRLAVAMIEAGRVLGDEPTFAPGGEEVAK